MLVKLMNSLNVPLFTAVADLLLSRVGQHAQSMRFISGQLILARYTHSAPPSRRLDMVDHCAFEGNLGR